MLLNISDLIILLSFADLIAFNFMLGVQMIPPRGCAYIVMVHRQDAYTALNRLSRGSYKVNQKPVKV